MSDGEWLIRQPSSSDGRRPTVQRITVEAGTASGTGQIMDEPDVIFGEIGITFRYTDGRELIYPWANILRAEYRPHTEP